MDQGLIALLSPLTLLATINIYSIIDSHFYPWSYICIKCFLTIITLVVEVLIQINFTFVLK